MDAVKSVVTLNTPLAQLLPDNDEDNDIGIVLCIDADLRSRLRWSDALSCRLAGPGRLITT